MVYISSLRKPPTYITATCKLQIIASNHIKDAITLKLREREKLFQKIPHYKTTHVSSLLVAESSAQDMHTVLLNSRKKL